MSCLEVLRTYKYIRGDDITYVPAAWSHFKDALRAVVLPPAAVSP